MHASGGYVLCPIPHVYIQMSTAVASAASSAPHTDTRGGVHEDRQSGRRESRASLAIQHKTQAF